MTVRRPLSGLRSPPCADVPAGKDVDVTTASSPHVVSGLLKLFFRDMPEPLFTFELYEVFLSIQSTCHCCHSSRYSFLTYCSNGKEPRSQGSLPQSPHRGSTRAEPHSSLPLAPLLGKGN